jgi:hypothetical protein
MKTMIVVWLLAMAIILGPAVYDAYVWNQIEQFAIEADRVEGEQE